MSGNGDESDSDLGVVPHKEPISVIVVISIVELFEVLIFLFIIRTSWTSYVESSKSKSCCQFLIKLSPLKKCFLVAAFVALAINTLFLVRLLLPLQYDDDLCSLMLRITGSTSYNLGMVAVYMYLWARQYLLHSSPVLRSVLPRWLPILSKVSLFLTLVAFLLPLVMVWLKGNVLAHYSNGFCYHKASSLTLFPALMMGATLITQSAYVILFYATLKLHQKANRTATEMKVTSSGNLAARCLKFALVAVITDCFAMVGIQLTGSRIPEVYVHLFPKLDIFFNLLCMLFCFNSVPDIVKKIVNMFTCWQMPVGNDDEATNTGTTRRKSSTSDRVQEV